MFLYVFIGFVLFFFRWRKQIFQTQRLESRNSSASVSFLILRPTALFSSGNCLYSSKSTFSSDFDKPLRDKKKQRERYSNIIIFQIFFFFFEHGMHGWNESSVYFVSSVFMFILTTDFRDLTDANHERKRANQIHQINPFLFSFSNTECTKETKAFVYSVSSVFR